MCKWVASLIIALPLLYVLSIGPVLKVSRANHTLEVNTFWIGFFVYLPLDSLAKNCKPFEQFLDWYIDDVWRVPPPSFRPFA